MQIWIDTPFKSEQRMQYPIPLFIKYYSDFINLFCVIYIMSYPQDITTVHFLCHNAVNKRICHVCNKSACLQESNWIEPFWWIFYWTLLMAAENATFFSFVNFTEFTVSLCISYSQNRISKYHQSINKKSCQKVKPTWYKLCFSSILLRP